MASQARANDNLLDASMSSPVSFPAVSQTKEEVIREHYRELGRKRARKLTAKRRREIALKAINARWSKRK